MRGAEWRLKASPPRPLAPYLLHLPLNPSLLLRLCACLLSQVLDSEAARLTEHNAERLLWSESQALATASLEGKHWHAPDFGALSTAKEKVQAKRVASVFEGDFAAADPLATRPAIWLFSSSTFEGDIHAYVFSCLSRFGPDIAALFHGSRGPPCIPASLLPADTTTERNYMQAFVFPDLVDLALSVGLTYNVVDLRWGIRNETTDDHATADLCLSEVRRCLSKSVGSAFMFFSGGDTPTPL